MERVIFGPVGMIDGEKGVGTGMKAMSSIIQTGIKANRITMIARIAWNCVANILGHGMMNRVVKIDHSFVNYMLVISQSTV